MTSQVHSRFILSVFATFTMGFSAHAQTTLPSAHQNPLPSADLEDGSAMEAPLLLDREDVRKATASLLDSPLWKDRDPTLQNASRVDIHVHQFSKRFVVRVTPYVDGLKVKGADRILRLNGRQWTVVSEILPLLPLGSFKITPEQAVHAGAQHVPGQLFTDTTVERLAGFAHRQWWASKTGLIPSYGMRIPSIHLHHTSDVWVNAESGETLQRFGSARHIDIPTDGDGGTSDAGSEHDTDDAGSTTDGGLVMDSGTHHTMADGGSDTDGGSHADAGETSDGGTSVVVDDGGSSTDGGITDDGGSNDGGNLIDAGPTQAPTAAKVFVWWPEPTNVDEDDLQDVQLSHLLPAETGSYLRGEYIHTYNCCKEYVCLDGSAECNMNDPSEARCATADDLEPLKSQIAVEVPADIIPFPFPSDVLYAQVAFCAELPRVKSKAADGDQPSGWYETPVDSTRESNDLLGLASEEDAFAEIQVYYGAMEFFLHLRNVLQDDTFCLSGSSMECDENGHAVLDDDGSPTLPFHIAVNALSPDIDLNAIGGQVLGGAGQSPGNPIVIEDYMRLDNAVFLPAFSSGPLEVPEELSALAEVFNRTYDSNIFFQGAQDFAYDSSIVFHEFGHAIVHTLNEDLLQASKDKYGVNGDPGALNEGWADYFSSSFTDESKIGTYGAFGFTSGEVGLRDADNDKRCPDDLTGEVHDDSEPWTGALWEIRSLIQGERGEESINELDALLWSLVAEADPDETIQEHVQRTLAALQEEFGIDVANEADAIFEAHNLNSCVRVFSLSEVDDSGFVRGSQKNRLYFYAPDQVGLDRSPGAIQFRVEVPVGTPGFELHWKQGTLLESEFGGEPQTMRVLVHESTDPIEWKYEGSNENQANPYDSEGRQISFNHDQDTNKANMADPTLPSYGVELDAEICEKRTFHVSFVNAEGGNPIMSDIYVELLPVEEASCEGVEEADGGTGRPVNPGEDDPADCSCEATSNGDTQPFTLFGLFFALSVALIRRRRA